MSYITFNRNELVDLSHSLKCEYLEVAGDGAFATQTIAGVNTRKYHGLYIAPQPKLENENYLLLSSLDETLVKDDNLFNVGTHKYTGNIYEPKGYKYLSGF